MPISPFAREALAEILATLEKNSDLLASLVFQEGLEDEIPGTVPEDLQNAIAALQAALAEPTVAEARMAERRAAWNEAEKAFEAAHIRHEAVRAAYRLEAVTEAKMADENLLYSEACFAYREAKDEALNAGFIPA